MCFRVNEKKTIHHERAISNEIPKNRLIFFSSKCHQIAKNIGSKFSIIFYSIIYQKSLEKMNFFS